MFSNVVIYFSWHLFEKCFVKSKVRICKNPARNAFRGCLGDHLFFTYFELSRNHKICATISQAARLIVREDNSWNNRKFYQSFSQTSTNFFVNCLPRFQRFLTFLNIYLTVYYIYGTCRPITTIRELILSVVEYNENKLGTLQWIKAYWVPSILYGRETSYLDCSDYHLLNVIRNNSYRRILNCCWGENITCLAFRYAVTQSLDSMYVCVATSHSWTHTAAERNITTSQISIFFNFRHTFCGTIIYFKMCVFFHYLAGGGLLSL